MEGSGNLPKFADNLYRDDEDDLWMIPTAEVPITNLYRDEILPPDFIPRYFVSQTPASGGRRRRPGETPGALSGYTSLIRWRCISSSTRKPRMTS